MRLQLTTLLALCAATLAAVGSATAASVPLAGTGHTGYLAFTGFNNEFVEPNTGDPLKTFDYPFFESEPGLWKIITAEPLSTGSDYSAITTDPLQNVTVTDADFGDSWFGSIDFDGSQVSGVGAEVVSLAASDVSLDLTMFSPIFTTRNVNNEFAWAHSVVEQSLASASLELTYADGLLTSIDGVLNIGVSVELLANPALSFLVPGTTDVLTYDGTITFSGDQFAFDINEVEAEAATFLGTAVNSQLVFNRAGTLTFPTQAIPEPAGAALLAAACSALGLARRR